MKAILFKLIIILFISFAGKGVNNILLLIPDNINDYFGVQKPGKSAIPFATDMLASIPEYYTRSITFTPDGREAYWSVIDLQDGYKRWIHYSQIVDGKWSTPAIAPFSKKGLEDDVPCISPDGEVLLFLSMRPIPGNENGIKENIWMVKRDGNSWTEPEPLPGAINDLGGIHQQISLDQYNNLYFGCVTDENSENMDIYRSNFINGKYQKPVKLCPAINSPDPEWAPFISPEESFIIFTRLIADRWTLYISFKKSDGSWTESKEIECNILGLEKMNLDGAFVSRDGKYLMFFGENKDRCIPYWIDASILQELKPKNYGKKK